MIAYEAATNEESKPENQYDTRALEASYIAGAQAKRAGDLEELLNLYKYVDIKSFKSTDAIASTALVRLENNNKKLFVFVMSKGGGMNIRVEDQAIQVVTPSSPLGKALLDLKAGDTAFAEIGSSAVEYEIISVE